jgi:hypothetical protein
MLTKYTGIGNNFPNNWKCWRLEWDLGIPTGSMRSDAVEERLEPACGVRQMGA